MRNTIFCLLAVISLGGYAQSTSAETEVRAVVDQLFDSMREGDSAKARSLFHSSCQMYSSFPNKEGVPQVRGGNGYEGFVKAIGSPHDKVWDERISNVQISVDDHLANAWMDYQFYLGEKFSHCGVNNFVLANTEDGWKIMYLIDTRRKDNCE